LASVEQNLGLTLTRTMFVSKVKVSYSRVWVH
jgi:hypothetical protein